MFLFLVFFIIVQNNSFTLRPVFLLLRTATTRSFWGRCCTKVEKEDAQIFVHLLIFFFVYSVKKTLKMNLNKNNKTFFVVGNKPIIRTFTIKVQFIPSICGPVSCSWSSFKLSMYLCARYSKTRKEIRKSRYKKTSKPIYIFY